MDLFDLADWLQDCAKDCKEEIEREVHISAKKIQAQAKLLAPVDTGNLRNNINTSVKWEGNACVGIISADTEYSAWVEFGTGIYNPSGRQTPWVYTPDGGRHFYTSVGQQPQPFMIPAFLALQAKIYADLSNFIGRLFN